MLSVRKQPDVLSVLSVFEGMIVVWKLYRSSCFVAAEEVDDTDGYYIYTKLRMFNFCKTYKYVVIEWAKSYVVIYMW